MQRAVLLRLRLLSGYVTIVVGRHLVMEVAMVVDAAAGRERAHETLAGCEPGLFQL